MPPEISPLISVIVVCKNPDLSIREALASVWAQHISPAPELIVVDGSTEDGSRVWLASQRSRIATLIMESDKGIYDAMNKGIAKATGEWVIFFGANDKFVHDGVLNRVQTALKQVAGGVAVGEIAYDDGRIVSLPAKPNPVDGNFAQRQGTFYRRTLFTDHGLFDASLEVQGDYDFNIRVWKKKVVFAPLPLRICVCAAGGVGDSRRWRAYQEEITVRHRHFPGWKCWLADLGSVFGFLGKKSPKRASAAKA